MADIDGGLWSRWSCDDAADGQITDAVGGRHLTVTSGTGATAAFPKRVNQQGQSRQFSRLNNSGTQATPDNYARAGSIPTADYMQVAAGAYTLAFWLRSTGAGACTGLARPIVIGGGTGVAVTVNSARLALVQYRFDLTPKVITMSWSGADAANKSTTFAKIFLDHVWYHVAFVVTPGTTANKARCALYVDGLFSELGAELDQPWHWTASPSEAAVTMSRPLSDSELPGLGQFGGFLRDVRMYRRALSASDISLLWSSTFPTPMTRMNAKRDSSGVDLTTMGAPSDDGDAFETTGSEVLIIRNTSGGSVTATFTEQNAPDNLTTSPLTVTVDAGETRAVGPFPIGAYADRTGQVQVLLSSTSGVTISAMRVNRSNP